jgi:hypothetical protein
MLKNPDVIKRIRRGDCLNYEKFDEQYNIDTGHPRRLADDNSGDLRPGFIMNSKPIEGSNAYEASALEYLDMVNAELSKDPEIGNYTFIDIGSGKGKVIFYNLIQNSPYKDYIGIEADDFFNNIALNNLKTFNMPITKDVKFLEMNGLDYEAEEKDCVYYFYLPFYPEIFHKFMEKNWETIKKTNSYFVFLFEDTYDFQRYLGKKPIYDFAELVIYSLKD